MSSNYIQKCNQVLNLYNPALSLQQNAVIMKRNPSTIFCWTNSDMFTPAQQDHLNQRGWKHHLSPQQESLVYTWISQRAIDGISTLGKDIISYISNLTNFKFIPKENFISRLCKLSMRLLRISHMKMYNITLPNVAWLLKNNTYRKILIVMFWVKVLKK